MFNIDTVNLVVIGMGVVFVVLTIDYFLILVIGLFREKPQATVVTHEQDFQPKTLAGEGPGATLSRMLESEEQKPPPFKNSGMTGDFDLEIIAASMIAICAYDD